MTRTYVSWSLRPGLENLENHEPPVDVFINLQGIDIQVLPTCVRSIRTYLSPPPNRIVVVSAQTENQDLITRLGLVQIDESSLSDLFPRNKMRTIVSRGRDRTGWYFQQLLKWAVRSNSETEDYVIVDADTVFVAPVCLRLRDKYVFHRSGQHHLAYFVTFEKLLGYRPQREPSYIVNYMIMNRSLIEELIERIEDRGHGRPWHAIILDSIDLNQPSSFSEFETYGYYMSRFHPDLFTSIRDPKYSPVKIPRIGEMDGSLVLPRSLLRFHPLQEQLAKIIGFSTISYHRYAQFWPGARARSRRN